MKRSKKLLSLLLSVLLLMSTVVSATVFSAAAEGTLSSYYATNPNGNLGKSAAISIDGSLSDWDSSMLIAQGTANDDPRVYRPNSMYEVGVDLYALYGAYDDNNLYLMWEMTNVQDVVAPNDNYPLSQGVLWQTQELPFFIMVDTGKSDTAIGNNAALTTGGTIWNSGMTVQQSFNKLVAINTKGGNGPWVYGGDSTGLNPKEILTAATSKVEMSYGLGILSENVYGINGAYGTYNNRVPGDVCDENADWVDFNTLGHKSDTYDFFYEMSIPYSELGITKSDVEANGVGVMVVATMGMSPMDCLPADACMTDQADLDDAANSQENNSFEKSDEDFITAAFARIGKEGGSAPIAPVPTTGAEPTASATAAPTTADMPIATAPVTPTPTDSTTAPEPTEAPTTVEPTSPTSDVPVIIPSAPATSVQQTTTLTVAPTTADDSDPATTASVPVVEPENGILGDTDGNKTVNIKDATLIQKHLAKIIDLDSAAQKLADVDGNGTLNIRDVTYIQKWLAKIDVEFPIGTPVSDGEIIVPVVTTAANTTATPLPTDATENTSSTATEPTEATTVELPASTAAVTTDATDAPSEPSTVTEPTSEATIPPEITTAPTDIPTEPVGGDTITIYFENDKGWNNVFYHAWNSAGGTNTPWPGDSMENVGGNTYKAEIDASFTGIVFNDGTGSDSAKTTDLTIPGDGQIYKGGSWSAYDGSSGGSTGGDTPVPPTPATGKTVYFTNTNSWSTVSIYCWNNAGGKNGEWPGVQMTLEEEDNGDGEQVYSYELSSEYGFIIFSGDGQQTGDIDLSTITDNGFYLNGETVNTQGHLGVATYNR